MENPCASHSLVVVLIHIKHSLSEINMAHLNRFKVYKNNSQHNHAMEQQQDVSSSASPTRTNPMSAPFTFQMSANVPTSNHEMHAHYVQPFYSYQQSISAHTSPTHTPFYGQTTMLHPNQTYNEHATNYFCRPTTSYPESPPTQPLSPHQTPFYNPAAFPLHLPNTTESNMASSFGIPHFPQPNHSNQRNVSPTRQDPGPTTGSPPQRPQYNPAAAPFSSPSLDGQSTVTPSSDVRVQDSSAALRGISAIRLARPPGRRIQHSPPRRAFHESSSPPRTQGDSREIRLRDRLRVLQQRHKQALADFRFSGKEVEKSLTELDVAWGSEVANQHLDELYVMQNQLNILKKQNCEYGKDWKALGEEINELFGDIMVPGESEVE